MNNNEEFVNPVKILLVEDNPGDVLLTKEALDDCKMYNKVYVVDDGEKALDFLHRRNEYTDAIKPDLILLDLNLPKVDGREVLKEIKTDEELKSIPVVILTTSEAEEDILKSYKYHANCYISKPLDLDRFIEVVKVIDTFWMGIVKLPT